MSRLAKKAPSLCSDSPLDKAEVQTKLRHLSQLLRSCVGPSGRLKQVHNNIGGQVTTTSTSCVLLAAISSSHPLLNLIIQSVRSHVSRFCDCGLQAGILCISLIEASERGALRGSVAIRVYKHLLSLCDAYLHQDKCGCVVQLDFSSSQNFITLARSVVSSKPACVLTGAEQLHISTLLVKSFLLTVPCSSPGSAALGRTITMPMEGLPVLDSAVFPGVLLDLPEFITEFHTSGPLRVALFAISLAGDLPGIGDGTVEVHQGVDTDSQVVDELMKIAEQVVQDEVKLLVCQKVVHPVLQHYLRSHGVVVVERVGIRFMEPLAELTGARPVGTLHTAIPSKAYGEVKNVQLRPFGSKNLLHLHPAEQSVTCTMVLCHRNETMLNELKVACQKAEHVLRLTLREPKSLLGGGCTETHLAAYIRHQCEHNNRETASTLGCTPGEYLLGVEAFCSSLECVARALEHSHSSSIIDPTGAHHWTLQADVTPEQMQSHVCGCGLRNNYKRSCSMTEGPGFSPELPEETALRCRVLDSFTAKKNALQVAVETANIVLDVNFIIQDKN
ncbi:McKusick-Kaufman/Bardet-Biedl syndromes putative chaperonin [Synchiropus splendidus]|uniref:McKusick-Kaufman/Bardet-Biedl syndromes putative chaperonin n=1 Tax=Synchiropus splendidus TaxID=270530 RepID=UPI00237D33CA|nr:McKusick-Kaufman/Bardet-Biedl syndromes putative chaperonin [Synchiropus splendidus]